MQFQVYTEKVGNVVETNLGYRVVFDLLQHYLQKGHRVYFDNYYTSVQLVMDLAAQQTFSCGTIRSDRKGLPKGFKGGKLQKGDTLFWQNDGVTAVTWQDKRTVHAISSIHGSHMVEIPQRRGEAEPVRKPQLIAEYNVNMNGVDKCDQYLNYYSIGRKAKKWWKKVFFRLLELSIINAMVLFFAVRPEFSKKKEKHKKFREALVHELLQPLLDQYASGNLNLPRPGRRSNISATRLTGKHFPETAAVRKRCVVCSKLRIGKFDIFWSKMLFVTSI